MPFNATATTGATGATGANPAVVVFRDSDIAASITKATKKVDAIQTVVDARAAAAAAYAIYIAAAEAVTAMGPGADRTAVDQASNNALETSNAARFAAFDAATIVVVDQAAEDQAAADQANAADAANAANAAQTAVNTVNTAQADLDVATKTADDIGDSLNQAERALILLYKAKPRDNTAIGIAGDRCDDLDNQLTPACELVVSFKNSFQDALCNAAAATQVYAVYMFTNAKNMINAVSNVQSAQAAVDVAQLAVDAAQLADKYATQYSDFVATINPIPYMGMGMGMGKAISIIDPRALVRAKALLAATRAADVHAALQNATNYYNIALAAADKYKLE